MNFEAVQHSGLQAYIKKITETYSIRTCHVWEAHQEAKDVPPTELRTHLMPPKMSAQLYAENLDMLIQQLQLYIFIEDDGQPFLEVTFSPQDVNLEPGNIDAFVSLMKAWQETLQATTFYVRYENVSWRIGDTSRYSGVIYTADTQLT